MFLAGDKVKYVGQKFSHELHSKLGVVLGPIKNQSCGVVVDFGDDAYVVNESSLIKMISHKEPDFVKTRKHYDDVE